MATNDELQTGRVKNEVLNFFERQLSVPRIYLDAEWAGQSVDVLALNRDGSGDAYAALLFIRPRFDDGGLNAPEESRKIEQLMDRFESVSTHFKYLVAVDLNPGGYGRFKVPHHLEQRIYSPNGIGRIGFLVAEVHQDQNEAVHVQSILKAERFRARIGDVADFFLQTHTADWEMRT